MNEFISELLPALLKTLSDESDDVVLMNLKVLARISLHEIEFQRVLNAIVDLFSTDRRLLETRGSLIIRKLCVLLNAKSIYIRCVPSPFLFVLILTCHLQHPRIFASQPRGSALQYLGPRVREHHGSDTEPHPPHGTRA